MNFWRRIPSKKLQYVYLEKHSANLIDIKTITW